MWHQVLQNNADQKRFHLLPEVQCFQEKEFSRRDVRARGDSMSEEIGHLGVTFTKRDHILIGEKTRVEVSRQNDSNTVRLVISAPRSIKITRSNWKGQAREDSVRLRSGGWQDQLAKSIELTNAMIAMMIRWKNSKLETADLDVTRKAEEIQVGLKEAIASLRIIANEYREAV